ncbi:MAG TPA: hypothetical protein VGL61_06470 [Kofleriaceae bacterium]|jgi:hypothetical protein
MDQEGESRSRKPGTWPKGVSGNPGGRTRSGMAFADAVRRKVDPEEALDLMLRYVRDESVPLEKRLAMLLPWLHAGYLKPPTATAIDIRTRSEPVLPAGFDAMSLAEKARVAAEIRARADARLLVGDDDTEG